MNSIGKTVAVTGAPFHLMFELNNIFNFDKIYGTTFEVKDYIYTGKIKKDRSIASEKRKVIKNYISKNNINLKKSFAFGDTEQDIPLLESVSNPFPLNPNKELIKKSKIKGWSYINKDLITKINNRLKKLGIN